MLPSETMIWQPEFTDKTLSRKPGAVQLSFQVILSQGGEYKNPSPTWSFHNLKSYGLSLLPA
ncbi:hypothetical protein F7F75_27020 [Escherichia coli]|nr:hypothetical protein F7F75_27020 [Escherichia coli]